MAISSNAEVAAKVRGVAAERRVPHAAMAKRLNLSTMAISRRMSGTTPFAPDELIRLGALLDVPVATFFGESATQIPSVPEVTPPAVSVTEAPATPVLDAVPDPGVEGGGASASALVSGSGAEDSSAA
jgi:transcriptional regulator with XRE-family HTH domain